MSTIEELKQDLVFEAKLKDHLLTFHTTWGVFSPRGKLILGPCCF